MKRYNQLFYETQVGTVTSEIVINFLDKYCQNIQKKTVIIIDQASIHTSEAFMEKLEEWEKKNGSSVCVMQWTGVIRGETLI